MWPNQSINHGNKVNVCGELKSEDTANYKMNLLRLYKSSAGWAAAVPRAELSRHTVAPAPLAIQNVVILK
jgi:hypothetical protein